MRTVLIESNGDLRYSEWVLAGRERVTSFRVLAESNGRVDTSKI